jgi:hypothetical protein
MWKLFSLVFLLTLILLLPPHDLEGYAIAATKNQVFEAIVIMMLRSLQAISRAFFMINLPSRVPLSLGQGYFKNEQERD